MARQFKNALCLAVRPEMAHYARWFHMCHRRQGHVGQHRCVYPDAVVEFGKGIEHERKTLR